MGTPLGNKKIEAKNFKLDHPQKCQVCIFFVFLGKFLLLGRIPLFFVSKVPRQFVFEYWTPFVKDGSAVIKDGILRFD